MNNQSALLDYRRASTQHASVVGLVIALHDTLVGDLRRAADAMDRGDIPTRCEQLVHGFKVLTQLEAMLDMTNGGETALRIGRFYKHVRGQMLTAQFKLSSETLRTQMKIVVEIRQAWQQVDSSYVKVDKAEAGNPPAGTVLSKHQSSETEARPSFSCSG